ncbi:DUF4448 domain-containing protein ASCRUDRAFT_25117, partial [Ascoidea rubescens DSM 1968]
PEPWVRTIYSSIVEVVHPTVIDGITFSAKPSIETNIPQPWISLNNQGRPKTIKPKFQNGYTKNGYPDYSTWFKEPVTKTYDQKELKAHNMKDGDKLTQIEWIDEDKTYVSLNPVIRCTPNRYKKKGSTKILSSEPFCTPTENSSFDLDKVYFISWYTKYFKNAKNIRLHLAYVSESIYEKNYLRKRDEIDFEPKDDDFESDSKKETDSTVDKNFNYKPSGIEDAFFTSEWMLNENGDGMYPLIVDPDWIGEKNVYKKVVINLQPDNVADDDFDLLTNGTIVTFRKRAKVDKKEKHSDNGFLGEFGSEESKYMIMMAMPTVVIVFACIMYFLLQLCAKDRDISEIRR